MFRPATQRSLNNSTKKTRLEMIRERTRVLCIYLAILLPARFAKAHLPPLVVVAQDEESNWPTSGASSTETSTVATTPIAESNSSCSDSECGDSDDFQFDVAVFFAFFLLFLVLPSLVLTK